MIKQNRIFNFNFILHILYNEGINVKMRSKTKK